MPIYSFAIVLLLFIMFEAGGTKVKKKRNRVPTSCENCRKRKLKCDRLSPCGNCTRSSCESSCKYVSSLKSSSSAPKVQLNSEVIRLKMKINQLEKILKANNIDSSDYSNLLTSDCNISSSQASPQDDPIMSMTDRFEALVIKENKLLHSGTTAFINFVNSDKQLSEIFNPYIKRHAKNYDAFQTSQHVRAIDVMNEKDAFKPEWLSYRSSTAINSCDLTIKEKLVSPTSVNISESKLMSEIINDINRIMPALHVVHKLVDNFFKHVYPIFPYINEEIFKDELNLVLIPMDGGGCKVGLTHFQNASIVSLLLIILRFSYLTIKVKEVKNNLNKDDLDALTTLINNGVRIEHKCILYAKTLLMSLPSNDTVFKKVSLRNIQTLLYLRLYQLYSPELNEESAENSITLALIIQMTHVLGANLDPTTFSNFYKDERVIIVWRRIYYKLLELDATSAYHYASPLIINDNEWSIKLPKLNEADMETLNAFKKNIPVTKNFDEIQKLAIENSININIALSYEFYKLAKEGLSIFQNFTNTNKKSQYLTIVEKIENFLDNNIPSFYELINERERSKFDKMFDISNIKLFEIRLSLSSFLQTFYYLLYLFELESDSEDVYTFALKATEIAMVLFKVGYDYANYMNESEKINGNSKSFMKFKEFSGRLECYIFNLTQTAYQRSNLWISSMFMRNLVDNGIRIENLMKDFTNSVDSSVVLNWFNVDIVSQDSTVDNKELMILIFNYTKDIFFMLHHLKSEFFIAWRNSTVIQLFINKFKEVDKKSCQLFMDCDIQTLNQDTEDTTFPASIFSDSLSGAFMVTNYPNNNLEEISEYTTDSSISSKTPNSGFQGEYIPMTNEGLEDLFYDNVDNLVEDIFNSNQERATLFKKFDLFDTRDYNSNDPLEGFMNEFGTTPQMDSTIPSLASKPSTSSGVTNDSSMKYDQLTHFTPASSSRLSMASPTAQMDPFNLQEQSDGKQFLADFGMSFMENFKVETKNV